MKKINVDLSSITTDDLKKELANRLGTSFPEKEQYSLDTLDWDTALNTCNYFTQVISSDDLLKHGMCIGMSRLKNKENSRVIYLCKTNKKGIMQSIPATEEDLEELKTMKFHLVTIGSDSILPEGLSFNGKEAIKDVEQGPNAALDEKIKGMLTQAQKNKAKVIKDPNSYKDLYSHDMQAARKSLYKTYEKPKLNIFQRLWYKITGKYNKPDGLKQLFSESCSEKQGKITFIDRLDFDDSHYTKRGQKLNKFNGYKQPDKDSKSVLDESVLDELGLK